MARFFICSDVPLLKGNAGFNYLVHMSEALVIEGHQVVLIGIGSEAQRINFNKWTINLVNINWKKSGGGKIKRYIDFFDLQFNYGQKCISVLEKFHITKDDFFVFYPMNISIIKDLKREFDFVPQNHFSVSVVEWMQPEDYKLGIFDLAYWCFFYWFHFIVPKVDKILPISQKINDYYKAKGKETYILKPLVDCEEYSYDKLICPKTDGKKKFIYTGGADNKDAISEMICAFDQLSDNDKKKVELHLTGVSNNNINKIMKTSVSVYEKLVNNNIIIHHDWMEYDELIKLYCEMDYLLLARKSKTSTEANYPSKLPEAMLCGVVPICSNVGDYPKVFSGKDAAILFNGYKENEIRNAIEIAIGMSEDEYDRMKQNTLMLAKREFNISSESRSLEAFLNVKEGE